MMEILCVIIGLFMANELKKDIETETYWKGFKIL